MVPLSADPSHPNSQTAKGGELRSGPQGRAPGSGRLTGLLTHEGNWWRLQVAAEEPLPGAQSLPSGPCYPSLVQPPPLAAFPRTGPLQEEPVGIWFRRVMGAVPAVAPPLCFCVPPDSSEKFLNPSPEFKPTLNSFIISLTILGDCSPQCDKH